MKHERNIFIAFLLNLFFSIFEFIGGSLTGSISIISDAIHDIGDALSIGISYLLERISKRKPNHKYTYGYLRYSVLGGLITTCVLIIGSIVVIINSIDRIIYPVIINYDGMIILAIIGFVVNAIASYITHEGHSINEKTVNLHMLEDVLGWALVLIGAIIMRISDVRIIDPILSIAVALFILINALTNLKQIMDLFLEKTPNNISIPKIEKQILKIKGVDDVHHIHVWSIDGINNYATMHVVSKKDSVKDDIKKLMKKHGISHVTIETENEICETEDCEIND